MIVDAPAFLEKVIVVLLSVRLWKLIMIVLWTGKYQIESQDCGQPGLNHVYMGIYTLATSCSRGNDVLACSVVD